MQTSLSTFAKTALIATIIALAFAAVYGQQPLYSSNQNTYFLHGLARAGVGNLSEDWLAQTTDPFPLFSALVCATYRFLPQQTFYLYQFILEAIYILSLIGIALTIFPPAPAHRPLYVFILSSVLVLLHAPRLAYELGRIPVIGDTLSQLFSWQGMAGQFVLGYSLQPSAFGVFLLLSILLFLHDKPYWAVISSGLAACFHSTYLLVAAELTLCYLAVIIFNQKDSRRAFFVALLALAVVMPSVIYSYLSFSPQNEIVFDQAEDILYYRRIPHHARIDIWFNAASFLQLLAILLGISLAKKTRLSPILRGVFSMAVVLTFVLIFTGNISIALLFPWRASVILIPLALTVIIGYCLAAVFRNFETAIVARRRLIAAIVGILVVAAVAHEGRASYLRLRSPVDPESLPALNFVAEHHHPGDVYIFPHSAELDRFRLATGMPAFIDFKSHPYKDAEVLQWDHRVERLKEVFGQKNELDCTALRLLASQYRITHVIVPQSVPATCALLEKVFGDGHFTIYRISTAE